MLEHCKHLLTSVERMQEDLHQYISTEHHTISLGSSWMTFQSSFFSFCDYFQKNNPDISMPLSLVSPATLMQGICNGKFDIGFTYMLQNFVLPDLLESIPIEDGQMVLAVASDHELAQTFSGKLSDIESYPNVYPTNNVKAIFEIRPPEEATATYVENMSEIGFQILLGRAIAIVPEHSLAWFPPGVIHLPIKENVTRYKVCILYHKKFKNPSTQQFLDEWEMFNKSDKQL